MEFGAQALLSFNMEKGRMKINFDFTVAEKQSWAGASGLWTVDALRQRLSLDSGGSPKARRFLGPEDTPHALPSKACSLKGPLLKGLAF